MAKRPSYAFFVHELVTACRLQFPALYDRELFQYLDLCLAVSIVQFARSAE